MWLSERIFSVGQMISPALIAAQPDPPSPTRLKSRLRLSQVRRGASCFAAMFALWFCVDSASAQKSYIGPLGTTTAPTTGNWNLLTNWSLPGVPANSASLSFGGSGSSTYTSTNNISSYVLGAVSRTSPSPWTDIIGDNSFNLGATSYRRQ